jgi:hypothetical protein
MGERGRWRIERGHQGHFILPLTCGGDALRRSESCREGGGGALHKNRRVPTSLVAALRGGGNAGGMRHVVKGHTGLGVKGEEAWLQVRRTLPPDTLHITAPAALLVEAGE